MGELFGLLTRVSDDRLDDSRGRQQRPASSQLIDDGAGKQERLGDGLRDRHRERHDHAKVVTVESGIAELPHEVGEMRAAGFIATGIFVERLCRHVDLIGDEGEDRVRRFLAGLQHAARPTHVEQQRREPEPARRSPAFADKIEILTAEGEVTGYFPFVGRGIVMWGKRLACQQLPSCHASRPFRHCPSDGPLAASMNMSVNSGPAMAIRTRMQIDGKTDRLGPAVALIGYARVSTGDQKLALQHDALNAAGCERTFDDHASGAKTDRPGLAEALAYLRAGDTLVVWKLDRLGRSMSHLIGKVGELAALGVGFRSLTEQIDTTTSGGMLVFNIFGSLAQFERDLIRERTNAGLKAARERGSLGGRRPVITPDKLRKARDHIAAGLTVREAATRLKVGKTALYKALEGTDAKTAVKV